MSNLQVLARRCPVMSKALAVQSARINGNGTKRFTSSAAGVSTVRAFRPPAPADKRMLHTTGGHPASVAAGSYQKNEQGECFITGLDWIGLDWSELGLIGSF